MRLWIWSSAVAPSYAVEKNRNMVGQLHSFRCTKASKKFRKIYFLCDFWCTQTCSFWAIFGLLSALYSDVRNNLYRCTSTFSALYYSSGILLKSLHCALSIAAQCIAIGPVCGGRTGEQVGGRCLWRAGGFYYHDNSKLRASIFTKLGLLVQVVTASSWLNFGGPAPPGRGLQRGENFWVRLTAANAQCLRLSERLFHSIMLCKIVRTNFSPVSGVVAIFDRNFA